MIKNNQKLEKLRKEIDLLDRKIAGLIAKRFSVAGKIGKLKKKNKMKIENKNREKLVIMKVKKIIEGNKQKKAISNIYKEMIKQTKQLEK